MSLLTRLSTRKSKFALTVMLAASVCAAAVYRAFQMPAAPPQSLAAFAPEGALLALETPDFAKLLKSWTSSAEEKRWLASDDYAGFSRSRLFSRLGDAQDQFATTAGLPPDANFVQQMAGGQSLLAWYDIGNLEFLYITKMPLGQAGKTPLLQLRSKFEERKVGPTSFYVRTEGDTRQRTVAFAVQGDYLLLATRTDLIAGALQLMQQPADRTVQHEAWYANTVTAAQASPAGKPSDLRLTLNLTKIVPSPYFRSYWVQQNITEMKQYSAALSDLYMQPDAFHEERVMLPANPDTTVPSADLAPVLRYVPAHTGYYRAVAQPDAKTVMAQLLDKLIDRHPSGYQDPHTAPVADLSTPQAGDEAALEERIDDPITTVQPRSAELAPLNGLLQTTPVNAMLVFAATDAPSASAVLAPVHTAVLMSAATGWDGAKLQQSISSAMAPRLTIGNAGVSWQPQQQGAMQWMELTGLQGLAVAIQGNVCILASDRATLLRLLTAGQSASSAVRTATVIASFDHTAERPRFVWLAELLDNYHPAAKPTSAKPGQNNATPPPFFAGNMVSLSDTFQDLDAELLTQTTTPDKVTRQSVVYQWRH